MGYLIILLAIVMLVVRLKTDKCISIGGILMVMLFFLLLYSRVKMSYLPNILFNKSTLITSGIVTLTTSAPAIAFLLLKKRKRVPINYKYVLLLFLAYIPLAFGEQLFFLYIFFGTLVHLINNFYIAVIVTGVFFSLFHIRKTFFFFFGTLIGGLIWAYIYGVYGNIIWPTLSLAVFGALYYPLFETGNVFKKRFSF